MSKGTKKQKVGIGKPVAKQPRMARPSGRPPLASVASRHGSAVITRLARGFSMGELAEAGVPRNLALRWGLQIDIRRRGTLQPNVTMLRSWASAATKQASKEGEVRKVEEELVKVVKEIETEMKKEGTKVKKGLKKAGKEVAEKVEKPVKPRQRKTKAPKA